MQKLRLKYSFVALLVLLSFRGGGTEVSTADSVLLNRVVGGSSLTVSTDDTLW